MNYVQQNIINLIKSALTNEKYIFDSNLLDDELLSLLSEHSIIPLAYIGALNGGINKDNYFMKKMFETYSQCLLHSEKQLYLIDKVCTEFEKNEIDYMPVKGCNLKYMYPYPEMRLMGDADILIKEEQYEAIEKVMKSLGFTFIEKSDHDFLWSTGGLIVELHYILMYSYNKNYYEYFGNGWNLAKKHSKHKYSMTTEDEFIYLFVHFTKHYRIGGIGCRHVIDLWLYLKNNPDINQSYIEYVLDKLGIFEFYKNICKLIDVWFYDSKQEPKIDYMTDFIFNSGSWGTRKNRALSLGVKAFQAEGNIKDSRMRIIKNSIFPNIDEMRLRYKILEKYQILLPFMWIVRWINGIIKKPQNIFLHIERIKTVCKNDIIEYEKMLEYVGLDFKFKEDDEK